MKLRNIALLASLTVFAAAVSAAPKKAPAPAKVDPKAAAAAKAEAEAKLKAEAEAKAKAEAAPEGPPDKASWFNAGGNLVQGYTFNADKPADGYNGVTTWTDRANEYQLNQAWTYFEIPTDTKKKDFDFGLRVDAMFGSSYRFTTLDGFDNKIKTNAEGAAISSKGQTSGQYGLAIPQAYIDLAYKSVTLRIGHIISPVGFFTVDTTQNVFNTIPYTYQYGEPFTHTGVFAIWQATDDLKLMGGLTSGGDNFVNGFGKGKKSPGFLGWVSYAIDKKSTIDWVVSVSQEWNYKDSTNVSATVDLTTDADGLYNNSALKSLRYFQTLVYARQLTPKLKWVFQTDFGVQKVGDYRAAIKDSKLDQETTAMWYGANTYLIYQMLQTLQLAVNFEWFRDSAGVRVGQIPGSSGVMSMTNASARKNYIGDFYQVTFGPKWQPQKNFFVRVNGRYDMFVGEAVNHTATVAAQPWLDGTKQNQFIVGVDAAFLF